ncbi:hypothetical protein H6F74_12805 [Trichocoleus sp. FACHB-90]|nr:hypothetical protein [Trichocoleus sp. FACHB-90]MBD1927117.1 hypothetical protein [Trichocoleus sp. FACHB-90]
MLVVDIAPDRKQYLVLINTPQAYVQKKVKALELTATGFPYQEQLL